MPPHGEDSTTTLTTCAGVLALLEEDDATLKIYALNQINRIIDVFWPEIAESVSTIESLYEDEKFENRELAALIASKVFYHLGDESLDDSVGYALGAGSLFDVHSKEEYFETLVSRCIDQYIQQRVALADGKPEAKPIDPRLEAVVEKMFERCFKDHEYRQAAGIAMEAQRLEKMEEAIRLSDRATGTEKDCGGVTGMLAHCFQISQTHVNSRKFRNEILRSLVKIYQGLAQPDHISTCQCLMFLDDAESVAGVLDSLLKGTDDDELMSYQVAFDLAENELQHFLIRVRNALPDPAAKPAAAEPTTSAEAEGEKPADAEPASTETTMAEAEPTDEEKKYIEKMGKLKQVLSGEVRMGLYLDFLYRHNHADMMILKQMKGSFEARNSVCHSGTVLANALMHCGTTSDLFVRENMDWLKKATNWAKFSATAALGVINRGHIKESFSVLENWLPKPGGAPGASPYIEGGGLYALGLIHANHGEDVKKYLLNQLRAAGTQETVQHGAALGLSLACMGTCDDEIYEDLKGIMYTDSAVAGEAAGLAMGLVMLGSASDKALDEMIAYAHETQHEKIIRGLAVGMSLIMYGREEGADTMVEQLTRDKDPILRYGGMYTLAMAYCGTANNSAIRRLLHVAVSDVSDDVRRAAVTGLGFVLCSTPEQCPRVVALLSESYNPHVRYGATLAVGIACAGTGMKEAVELLEPMTSDATDYVRQGALIALAMVMVQVAEGTNPKVPSVRKLIEKVYMDKHEDTMAKFGAMLASGILDAGGRNLTIALISPSGHVRMPAVVGLAVFAQYWFWFPLTHFISISFAPTPIIGLNSSLKMPSLGFTSNCAPSMFAYPPMMKEATKEAASKVKTAVLSTTAKAKARAKKEKKDGDDKEKKEGDDKEKVGDDKEKKDGDDKKDDTKMEDAPAEKKDGEKKDDAAASSSDNKGTEAAGESMEVDSKKKDTEKEPASEILQNPARVVPAQAKYISWDPESRYQPVKKGKTAGILMLRDQKPGEEADMVEVKAPTGTGGGANVIEEDEPGPPEPFEYTD